MTDKTVEQDLEVLRKAAVDINIIPAERHIRALTRMTLALAEHAWPERVLAQPMEESATYSPTHIRSTPLVGDHPVTEVIAAAVRAIAQRAEYLPGGGSGDLDWAAISIVEKQTHHGQGLEVTVPIKKKERQS